MKKRRAELAVGTAIVLAALVVPTGFGAPPVGKGKPQSSQAATKNAAKACEAERAKDPVAFKIKYGTNKNKANAFGKCVSKLART